LTPPLNLAPRLYRKSTAIALLPLWAFMACYRLNFFTFTFYLHVWSNTFHKKRLSIFSFSIWASCEIGLQTTEDRQQRKFHYATRRLVELPHMPTKFHWKPFSIFKTNAGEGQKLKILCWTSSLRTKTLFCWICSSPCMSYYEMIKPWRLTKEEKRWRSAQKFNGKSWGDISFERFGRNGKSWGDISFERFGRNGKI